MVTSNAGIELIKSLEGLRLKAYQDQIGVWTIGYGHTAGVAPGQIITRQQADDYLRADLKTCEDALNKHAFRLRQNQFDALVSLFFNVGTGYLKNFVALLRENPDNELVTQKMMKYIYAGGNILQGLIYRRKKEVEFYKKKTLIETGVGAITIAGLCVAAFYTIKHLKTK